MTSCLYYHECMLYSPKCLTGLCAKVHQKNFMKLIKPGTFPLNEINWNPKVHNQIFTFIISSLKASKGSKRNTWVFSLIFQEIWYLIRFHQQILPGTEAWEAKPQRDLLSNLIFPTSRLTKVSTPWALGCVGCTPHNLVYKPLNTTKVISFVWKVKPLQKLDIFGIPKSRPL